VPDVGVGQTGLLHDLDHVLVVERLAETADFILAAFDAIGAITGLQPPVRYVPW
jgi:hypothetical protein